ncbi:MAG: glutathione S-transferase [Pseudomonadota bacterium]
MITLHHLEHSRSQRIAWLLEELDVDYDVKIYRRDPETILAPPELRDVHPLGKAPVITDDEITVAESGAIIEYLVDTYDDDTLRPAAGTVARRDFTFWLHYGEGSFMPLMLLAIVLRRIENAPVPFFVRPVAKGIAQKVHDNFLDRNVRRHLEFMEASLSTQAWFAGEQFTAADIQMSYCVEAAAKRADLAGKYPNLEAFAAKIRQRDAYRRAETRVESFELPNV